MSKNANIVYKNTVGLIIDIKIVGVDISDAENTKFYVLKPDNTEEIWNAVVVDNNVMRHLIPQDRQIMPGMYSIMPYYEIEIYKGWSETVYLNILDHYRT